MPSNIWLLALLTLGNTLSSESIGRIVRLDLPHNPDHRNAVCVFVFVTGAVQAQINWVSTFGKLRTLRTARGYQ
jgi:hypothetical protein